MDNMYADMEKQIEKGDFDPMKIFASEIEGYNSPSCKIEEKPTYQPPSDEISSRES